MAKKRAGLPAEPAVHHRLHLTGRRQSGAFRVPSQLDTLEQMALERRPELREEDYKTRIDVLETKRQIASLFPKPESVRRHQLRLQQLPLQQQLVQGGVGVSMNLFNY